jgi:hypothetical protein
MGPVLLFLACCQNQSPADPATTMIIGREEGIHDTAEHYFRNQSPGMTNRTREMICQENFTTGNRNAFTKYNMIVLLLYHQRLLEYLV